MRAPGRQVDGAATVAPQREQVRRARRRELLLGSWEPAAEGLISRRSFSGSLIRPSPTSATWTTRAGRRGRRRREGRQGRHRRPSATSARSSTTSAVDALVVATCNHWHAPAAILAAPPASTSTSRSRAATTRARASCSSRPPASTTGVVQMGNQRRSWPKIMRGDRAAPRRRHRPRLLRAVRGTATPARRSATARTAPVPAGLDYDLWQGPAPRRPFRDNILHYNWHWFWHWGNGELGNNGVHTIDVCRWGLGVDYPIRVTSGGRPLPLRGRPGDARHPRRHLRLRRPQDDHLGRLSCNDYRPAGSGVEIVFYGDDGTLAIIAAAATRSSTRKGEAGQEGDRQRRRRRPQSELPRPRSAARPTPHSEIEEGHKSTLLCHLGNIAYRTGRTLKCNPTNSHILNNQRAQGMWGRSYAAGWEKVLRG